MALRTVSNTGGNWNATTSWVGGVVPIAGDTVDFTPTSGPIVVNVSTANLVGIDFTNYVNTITFNNPINTNGIVNLGTGGYTQAGTSGLVINGSTTISGSTTWSRTFTINSLTASTIITLSSNLNVSGAFIITMSIVLVSTLSFSGVGVLNPTDSLTINVSVNLGFTVTLPNNITVTNLIFNPTGGINSVITLNSNSINVTGNLSITGGVVTSITGTTNINLTGTGIWSHTSATALRNNLTINSPSGTITISGNVYYNTGTLTYTTTLNIITTGSTLNIGTSTTLNTNGITWVNITIVAGTTTLSSNLILSGNFVISGTITGSFTLGIGGNFTSTGTSVINVTSTSISGDLTINGVTSGTSTITLNGTGTQTWLHNSAVYLSNNLTINKSFGTLIIGTNVYYNTGTLTYTTAGVVDTTTNNSTLNINATSTLNTNGINWNNVTITISTASTIITLSSNLNINNTFTLTMPITSASALSFSGVGVLNTSGSLIVNVSINLGFTVTLPNNITVTNLTFNPTGGINSNITVNSNSINVTGNLTILGAVSVVISGTTNINLIGTGIWSHTSTSQLRNNLTINSPSGTITISGNVYYNTGTLTYTAGSVTTTSSTLNIGGSTTLNTNGISWNNFTCNVTSTITLNSDLVWGGTMTLVNIVAATLSFSGTGLLLPTPSVTMIIGQNNYVTNAGNTIVNFPVSSVFNITSLTIRTGGASSIGYNCTMNNVTFNLSGNLTVSYANQAPSSVLGTLSSISMVGSGTITVSGTGSAIISIPFTINTSGTYSFSGTPYFSSTVNYLLGTISGATCIFTGASLNLNPGGKWGTDVILQGSITLLSNATFGNTATSTGGSLTLSGSFVMNVEGNLSINIPTSGVVPIIINGTSNQTWSHNSSGVLSNNLTINKPSGTLTIGSTFNIRYLTGTLTYTAGTVVTTGSTLSIEGSTTLNTNGISWNNFTCNVTSTITLNSNFTCIGVVSLASSVAASVTFSGTGLLSPTSSVTMIIGQNNYATNAGNTVINFPPSSVFNIISLTARTGGASSIGYNCTINNATFNLSGNLSVSWVNQGIPTINGTNSLINMIGTGTINGSGTNNVVQLSIPITINTTGTITFSGIINISNTTITYTSGTLTGVTVVMIGCTLNLNTGGIWAPPVALVGNTTLLSNANFTNLTTQTSSVVLSGLFNVTVAGNLAINITTSGIPSITLNGSGSQTWSHGSAVYLSSVLIINKPSGILTVSGSVYYSNANLTYTPNTSSVTTTNSTLFIGGSITLNTTGITWYNINISVTATVTFVSDVSLTNLYIFTNAGTNGTVTFSGVYNFNISGTLEISNATAPAVTTTVNLSNTINTNNLIIRTGSNGVGQGSVTTINNNTINALGNFTFTFQGGGGASANLIINGTTNIVMNGTGTLSSNYTGENTYYFRSNLSFNTTGVITVSGVIPFGLGTLSYVQGTVNVSAATLYLKESCTVNTSVLEWSVIVIYPSAGYTGSNTVTMLSDLRCFNLNVPGGTISFSVTAGRLYVNNDLYCGNNVYGLGAFATGAVLNLPNDIYINNMYRYTGVYNIPWGSLINNNKIYLNGGISIVQTLPASSSLTNPANHGGTSTIEIIGNFFYNSVNTLYAETNTLRYIYADSYIGNNLIFNTPIPIVLFNQFKYGNGTITVRQQTSVNGTYTVLNPLSNQELYILYTTTFKSINKIVFPGVIIGSGLNISMDEFFSGSPKRKTTITPSSTTNYTITFQDGFEKFAKFIKLSRATISRPNQLTVITDKGNQGNNVGVKFAPNQLANGLPKNTSTTSTVTPYGLQPSYLVTDPTLS